MLRPALLAIALLAAATPIALTFVSASESPDAAPRDPSTVPPYTQVHVDHGLLPAPTGWFAVPITTDRETWVHVDIDASMYEDGSRQLSLAQVILAVEGRESMSFMTLGNAPMDPPVHVTRHGGTLFACCDVATGSWTTEADASLPILLAPGETLWVGLAAYQWELDHWFLAQVSGQALLTMGEARTGLVVEAVDLAAEAVQAGTHVRALGFVAQPETGAAERTWTAEHFGLLSLYAYLWDPESASAKLTLDLPGTAGVAGPITDQGIAAFAHRAGTFHVRLDELDVPVLSQSRALDAVVLFADVDVPADAVFIYP